MKKLCLDTLTRESEKNAAKNAQNAKNAKNAKNAENRHHRMDKKWPEKNLN